MVNGIETTQERRNRLRKVQLKRSQKAIRKGTMNLNRVFDPSSTAESL